MKKVILGLVVGACAIIIPCCIVTKSIFDSPKKGFPFELWNKHRQPLYYGIFSSEQEAVTKPYELLRAGKWVNKHLMEGQPVLLALSLAQQPTAGSSVDVYELKPGSWKSAYLRIALIPERNWSDRLKELFYKRTFAGQDYIFGPQTGPLMGLLGSTERGHPLRHNITKDDIVKTEVIYQGSGS